MSAPATNNQPMDHQANTEDHTSDNLPLRWCRQCHQMTRGTCPQCHQASPITQHRSDPLQQLLGQTTPGGYTFTSLLSQGGMAWIFLAQDLHHREVVIKIPRDSQFIPRAQQEIQALSQSWSSSKLCSLTRHGLYTSWRSTNGDALHHRPDAV